MERLSLESLKDVDDGSIAHLVNKYLRDCYLDCDDRPHVGKDRTVTIKVKMKPDGQSSDFLNALVEFEVACSIPNQSVARVMKAMHKEHKLGFEADTKRTDYDDEQPTLEYADGE